MKRFDAIQADLDRANTEAALARDALAKASDPVREEEIKAWRDWALGDIADPDLYDDCFVLSRAEIDAAVALMRRADGGGSANPEHECKEDNPCLLRQYQDAEERLEAAATFLERATTRQCYLAKQAAEAERDALLRIINDSFLSMNNPTSTLAFDGRNLVPHVEDASRYAEILRLERDALKEKLAAMDLLLNNAERVVRDGIADRDAAESLAWDALGRPEGTHDTSNVQRLCEAHGTLKAKLAALVAACEMALDIDSEDVPVDAFHDKWKGAHGYGNGDGSREILSKALAAAKVQP